MNYIEIFEQINKYYPIGIDRFDNVYNEYEGIDRIHELCQKKLEKSPYKRWKNLVEETSKVHAGVISFDYESPLFYQSYCGHYLLHREKTEIMTYEREIHFHVSVLAPYYTIYGLDKVSLTIKNQGRCTFQPLLYVSPINIYEKWFGTLREKIEAQYKGFEFLEHMFLKKRVKSLSVINAKIKDAQDASVFQAFFAPDDITNYQTVG